MVGTPKLNVAVDSAHVRAKKMKYTSKKVISMTGNLKAMSLCKSEY